MVNTSFLVEGLHDTLKKVGLGWLRGVSPFCSALKLVKGNNKTDLREGTRWRDPAENSLSLQHDTQIL